MTDIYELWRHAFKKEIIIARSKNSNMTPNNEYTNYCYLFVCLLISQLSEVV